MSPHALGYYERNRRGWDSFANSGTLRDAVDAVAFRGVLYGISISPERTGEYRRSWGVEPALYISPRWGPRVAARIYNNSHHAAAVEFGNKRVRGGQHPMARVASFLGGTALPAPARDPAGSKRDKNGRLRDAKGRFI